MQTQFIKPSPKLLSKMRLSIVLVALANMLGGLLIAIPIATDSVRGAAIFFAIWCGVIVLAALVGIVLTGPYFRSLSYEVQDDEVIVHAGIVTKSVKHVPYRTVTNITVKRGLLDRYIFDLGTLNIQTAGMSGQTGAEESLIGLDDVQAVYDNVVTELRRFRGGMAPTAADAEPDLSAMSDPSLAALLAEVQAIRRAVEGR